MSAWAKLLCETESKTLQSRLVGNLFALEPGLLIYPEISGFQSNIILTKVKM